MHWKIALISKLCKTVNVHSDYSTLTVFNRTKKWLELETFSSTAIHIHELFSRQLLHERELKKRCLKFLQSPHELSLMVLIKRTKAKKEWTSVIDVWRRSITEQIIHFNYTFLCFSFFFLKNTSSNILQRVIFFLNNRTSKLGLQGYPDIVFRRSKQIKQ